MKLQPAVKAETKKIAAGVMIMTALMIAVFLILRQFDYTVILGALLGSAAAIGNFFLMALTVQKVTEAMPALPKDEGEEENGEDEGEDKNQPLSDEAKQAGKKMQLSYLVRMLALGAVAVIAFTVPFFHPWATVIPFLFPRIVIALMGSARKNGKEA